MRSTTARFGRRSVRSDSGAKLRMWCQRGEDWRVQTAMGKAVGVRPGVDGDEAKGVR